MRCDCCPLWPVNGEYNDNTCPEMDGPMGIEHKDGVSGCRHPWNWVKKRDDEYNEYLRKMGEEMGRMLDEEMKEKENEKNR